MPKSFLWVIIGAIAVFAIVYASSSSDMAAALIGAIAFLVVGLVAEAIRQSSARRRQGSR